MSSSSSIAPSTPKPPSTPAPKPAETPKPPESSKPTTPGASGQSSFEPASAPKKSSSAPDLAGGIQRAASSAWSALTEPSTKPPAEQGVGERVLGFARGFGKGALETGVGMAKLAQDIDNVNPLSQAVRTGADLVASPFTGRDPKQIVSDHVREATDSAQRLGTQAVGLGKLAVDLSGPAQLANGVRMGQQVVGDLSGLARDGKLNWDTGTQALANRAAQNPSLQAASNLADGMTNYKAILASGGDPEEIGKGAFNVFATLAGGGEGGAAEAGLNTAAREGTAVAKGVEGAAVKGEAVQLGLLPGSDAVLAPKPPAAELPTTLDAMGRQIPGQVTIPDGVTVSFTSTPGSAVVAPPEGGIGRYYPVDTARAGDVVPDLQFQPGHWPTATPANQVPSTLGEYLSSARPGDVLTVDASRQAGSSFPKVSQSMDGTVRLYDPGTPLSAGPDAIQRPLFDQTPYRTDQPVQLGLLDGSSAILEPKAQPSFPLSIDGHGGQLPELVRIPDDVTVHFTAFDGLYARTPPNTPIGPFHTVETARGGDLVHDLQFRQGEWASATPKAQLPPTLHDLLETARPGDTVKIDTCRNGVNSGSVSQATDGTIRYYDPGNWKASNPPDAVWPPLFDQAPYRKP